MRLIKYWMEKTAGWKKKWLQTRLAAGKGIPHISEWKSMASRIYELDLSKLPELRHGIFDKRFPSSIVRFGSNHKRGHINVLNSFKKDLQKMIASSEKRRAEFPSSPPDRRLPQYRYQLNQVDKILDNVKSYNTTIGDDGKVLHNRGKDLFLGEKSFPEAMFNRYLSSNGQAEKAIYSGGSANWREALKNQPEYKKQVFPLSQLHKRLSKELGHKVSPRDLVYRSGQIQVPDAKEIFTTTYPEVAAGYGRENAAQYNVALRKDLPNMNFTPHLATTADVLGQGDMNLGNNRRVASTILNRKADKPVLSPWEKQLAPKFLDRKKDKNRHKNYHGSRNKEWSDEFKPEYEATIRPEDLWNAPSRRTYVSFRKDMGDKKDFLSDMKIKNDTLLMEPGVVREMVDKYNSSLHKMPIYEKFLKQFMGKGYGDPSEFIPRQYFAEYPVLDLT